MSKQLSLSDFRAIRTVLEPDDFALGGDDADPPPSDLISGRTWHGIMNLPDDVAIRTSNHNGQVLGEVYWLWGRWIEATREIKEDALFVPMLDAHDDLQASIFDALHGYYRTAFSALRNAVELMTIGTCGALNSTPPYVSWRSGSAEFRFGSACDQLSNEPLIGAFNASLRAAGHQSLWDAKRDLLPRGYGRRLYRKLSNYAHSRPGFTDADLRESNGPIYAHRAFFDWYYAYLQTISYCSILMFLASPNGDRGAFADLFIEDPNVIPPDLQEAFKIVQPSPNSSS
jgi:hypothetical protein